jgi:4-amino-4-deoxy-L-arabinose transferase-like glycosyltransferase
VKRLLVILYRLADHGEIVVAIAVILIVAFGAVLSISQGNRVKSLDEIGFFDIGKNLSTHLRFAHSNKPEHEGVARAYDPTWPAHELRPTANRAPGYVFFIAPFMFFGAEYAALRIVNFVLMSLTLILLYYLLVLRYSRLAGLLGVLFVLGYPVFLYTASTLYSQSLEAFLLVATTWLLARTRSDAGLWVHALPGAACGLLILTTPPILLLAPVVLLWLVCTGRSRIHQAALTAGIMILVVGMWTTRNYLVFRAFVPVATLGGHNLLTGNNEATTYNVPSGMMVLSPSVARELTGKNEVDHDRILTRTALENMRKNPGRTFVLYWQKFLYWFTYSNELASDRAVPGGSASGPQWLRDVIMACTYGPLLGILILRLLLVRRFPLSSLEVLFLALYVGAGMVYAIFLTRIRYRLPFDWLLIALDAIFVARVIAGWSALPEHRSPAKGVTYEPTHSRETSVC